MESIWLVRHLIWVWTWPNVQRFQDFRATRVLVNLERSTCKGELVVEAVQARAITSAAVGSQIHMDSKRKGLGLEDWLGCVLRSIGR